MNIRVSVNAIRKTRLLITNVPASLASAINEARSANSRIRGAWHSNMGDAVQARLEYSIKNFPSHKTNVESQISLLQLCENNYEDTEKQNTQNNVSSASQFR